MKKLNVLLIIILLTVLIIPSVALAAWWNPFSWSVWNIFFSKHSSTVQQQSNKPTNQKQISLIEDKNLTAGWRPYTSIEYGFGFKYPSAISGLKMTQTENPRDSIGNSGTLPLFSVDIGYSRNMAYNGEVSWDISVFDNSDNLTLQKITQNALSDNTLGTPTVNNIKVGGVDGVEIKSSDAENNGTNKIFANTNVYLVEGNFWYYLHYANQYGVSENINTDDNYFNQMLATFNFVPILCGPIWTCEWGTCINGSQQLVPFDSNNCGFSTNIICPDNTRKCSGQPVISVTYPSGGEQLVAGKTYNITWTSSVKENLDIYLGPGSDAVPSAELAKNVSSDLGTYSVTIPSDAYAQGGYDIEFWVAGSVFGHQIGEKSNPLKEIGQSNPFSVILSTPKPSITVTSPNGGEIWTIGQTYNITWDSKNLDPNLPVTITLTDYTPDSNYPQGKGVYINTKDKVGDGNASVKIDYSQIQTAIPNFSLGGSEYKIEVYARPPQTFAQGESAKYFSIVAP